MDQLALNRLVTAHYRVILTSQLAHWNMAGKHFSELHQLTDDIYNAFVEKLDDFVEEVVSHTDIPVVFENFPTELDVQGNPHECLEWVETALDSYRKHVQSELSHDLSLEDEDTLIDMSHFVAHWLWKVQRNLA